MRRAARFIFIGAAVLSLAACRKQHAPDDEQALPPASSARPIESSAAAPVDQALPGELAEGTVIAFGLTLPRIMTIRGRFDDVVFATGDAAADQVANYVRQRVTADKIETGPEKTLFTRATVKGNPGPLVAVSVIAHNGRTELEVRDVTPKPERKGQSSDERWRELGLQPDGTPLDPTQLR
ncbi:Hypothetical protein A7982_07215 [Minicystis rosea]|nr:Hypothetical protein A7982_07215 [Minicystis rosea]